MAEITVACISVVVMREDYEKQKKQQEKLGLKFKAKNAYAYFGFCKQSPEEIKFYYSHEDAKKECQRIVDIKGVSPEDVLVISTAIFSSYEFTEMYSVYHYSITSTGKHILTPEL